MVSKQELINKAQVIAEKLFPTFAHGTAYPGNAPKQKTYVAAYAQGYIEGYKKCLQDIEDNFGSESKSGIDS